MGTAEEELRSPIAKSYRIYRAGCVGQYGAVGVPRPIARYYRGRYVHGCVWRGGVACLPLTPEHCLLVKGDPSTPLRALAVKVVDL
jgi:hypothetical protein